MEKILHIFCGTHHHNVSIIRYFNELLLPDTVHRFLIFDPNGKISCYDEFEIGVHFFRGNKDLFSWLRTYHHEYDEVLFHGFFNHTLWELLQEDVLFCNKSNWLMFGADLLMDLYFKEDDPVFVKTTSIRKKCVPALHSVFSNICSSIDDDICSAKYGKPMIFLKYAYYENYNVHFHALPESLASFLSDGYIVIVGNSADKTNRHIELISQVHQKWPNAKILCPMTYSGSNEYIDSVVKHGKQCFGDRFYPLLDMLPKDAYFYALTLCHALLLGHQRQQAGHHWVFWLKQGKALFGDCAAPIPADLIAKGATILDVSSLPDETELVALSEKCLNNRDIFDTYFEKRNIDMLWENNFKLLRETRTNNNHSNKITCPSIARSDI